MDELMDTVRIKLLPNKEQEEYLRKAASVANWAYNFALEIKNNVYEQQSVNVQAYAIIGVINGMKKQGQFNWVREVSSNIPKIAVIDCTKSFNMYLRHKIEKPHYKKRKSNELSFGVVRLAFDNNSTARIERLGKIKIINTCKKRDLGALSRQGVEFRGSRIKYDGKHWWLTTSFRINKSSVIPTGSVIGIDVGIKNLAILDNGVTYSNINKESRRIKMLIERRNKLYKVLKRKYKNNGNIESKNVVKTKQKIQQINEDLWNIRTDYNQKVTTLIVRAKPSMIVMENLNLNRMAKEPYLRQQLRQLKLSQFFRFIIYKSERRNIEFVQVPRNFKSTQLCSCCGAEHKMKLSERVYRCDNCGLVIDRDINAANNLKNYGLQLLIQEGL